MKNRWIWAALVLLTLAACEKVPEMPDTTDAAETTDAVPETTVPETTEAETTAPDTAAPETIPVVGPEIPALSAESDESYSFPFDDGNDVYILYDFRRDEAGEYILENGQPIRENIRVQIYDKTTGAFSTILPIEGNERPTSISFTDDGFVLYTFVTIDGVPTDISAWKVTREENGYSIAPTEYDVTVQRGRTVTSPDGKWSAYDLTTDLWGSGGVMLRDEQGEEQMIAVNVMWTEENPLNIGEVRGYSVIGFLDNTRLVYQIGGWEWSVGCGIYDVTTGETREILCGCAIQGIHDGALYGVKSENYETVGVYRIDPDGTQTLLADGESTKGTLQEIMFTGGKWYEFRDGKWLVISDTGDKSVRGLIFSADFSEVIADVTGSDRRQIYEEFFNRSDN